MKCKLTVLASALILANTASAASILDLQHQSPEVIQKLLNTPAGFSNSSQIHFDKVSTHVDANHVAHTRVQEKWGNIPVWDATAVIHAPANAKQMNVTMEGKAVQDIQKDIINTPAFALSDAQKQKALQQAKAGFAVKAKNSAFKLTEESVKEIIYVDENQVAHYAFLVSFFADDNATGAHRPTSIVDATTLKTYRQWDRVYYFQDVPKDAKEVTAGGIGGNQKTGPMVFDDMNGDPIDFKVKAFTTPFLLANGTAVKKTFCALDNDSIVVKNSAFFDVTVLGECEVDARHGNINWLSEDSNGTRWEKDEKNGGFSPSLDAMYDATIIQKMYQDWYGVPVLVQEDHKTPLKLIMRTHYGFQYENAFWDGKEMTFGDGKDYFYPLTSLDVGAHEISHGFTEEHSDIDGGVLQMGGLHEAFSDMAAAAAEFYTSGKNSWMIGINITKGDRPLRYMDEPTKDGMSIDNMKDIAKATDPHLAAGVFNKAFYLIATSAGWDTHKAFDVMVKANMDHWTSSMTTFNQAACGVVASTKELNYSVADVQAAFAKVGIDTAKC